MSVWTAVAARFTHRRHAEIEEVDTWWVVYFDGTATVKEEFKDVELAEGRCDELDQMCEEIHPHIEIELFETTRK